MAGPAPHITGDILMYASTANGPSSQSVLERLLITSREYRNAHVWVRIRVAGGIFNLVLGVLLLASAHWLGSLTWLAALPLAGAALIFWTAYRLQHSVQS
jgi:predicted phage tail protein